MASQKASFSFIRYDVLLNNDGLTPFRRFGFNESKKNLSNSNFTS